MSVWHRYCSEKRFVCRIEEDFNSTVGEQKEKFEQHLHCEILAQIDIQIPRRMIQDIDVSPGTIIYGTLLLHCGPGSVVGIATGYGLDGPGIESRWGWDFPHLSRPTLGPTQPPVNGYRVFPGGKERPGRDADPSPRSSAVVMKGWSYNSTPPMGHTACTEPQCLPGCAFAFTVTLPSSSSSSPPPSHPLLLLPLFPSQSSNRMVAELYIGFIFFRKETVHAMSC